MWLDLIISFYIILGFLFPEPQAGVIQVTPWGTMIQPKLKKKEKWKKARNILLYWRLNMDFENDEADLNRKHDWEEKRKTPKLLELSWNLHHRSLRNHINKPAKLPLLPIKEATREQAFNSSSQRRDTYTVGDRLLQNRRDWDTYTFKLRLWKNDFIDIISPKTILNKKGNVGKRKKGGFLRKFFFLRLKYHRWSL